MMILREAIRSCVISGCYKFLKFLELMRMPSWVTCSEIILYFNVNYYPNKTEHFGIALYLKPVTSNFLLDLENFHLWYTLPDLQYYS